MKALLVVDESDRVARYYVEAGPNGMPHARFGVPETSDPHSQLSSWFAAGWTLHSSFHSNFSGKMVLSLRDGKPL